MANTHFYRESQKKKQPENIFTCETVHPSVWNKSSLWHDAAHAFVFGHLCYNQTISMPSIHFGTGHPSKKQHHQQQQSIHINIL